MTKSDLLAQIAQEELTDDLRQEIEKKLADYPEELAQENIDEIEAYLIEVQQIELESAKALDEMADTLDDLDVAQTNNYVDAVNESVKVTASELRHANDMLDTLDTQAE